MATGRLELAGTTAGVVIAMAQIFAPLMILPLYANMQGIDRRLLGAAQSLGASPLSAFRWHLPLSLPGDPAGPCWCSCSRSVSSSRRRWSAPPRTHSPPSSSDAGRAALAFGRAGAMSVILLAITLLLVAIVAFGSAGEWTWRAAREAVAREDAGWRRPGRVLLAAAAGSVQRGW